MSEERPLNLRAMDRLAALGNRSALNPFLARAFEMFFAPVGVTAKHVEFAIIESVRGSYPPLYLQGQKLSLELVKSTGSRLELFQPLLDAPNRAEIVLASDLTVGIRRRPPGEGQQQDLLADALEAAIEGGLVQRINQEIRNTEEYFRAFLAAAVRVLAADGEAVELQEMFLADPAQFAEGFAVTLAATTGTAQGG